MRLESIDVGLGLEKWDEIFRVVLEPAQAEVFLRKIGKPDAYGKIFFQDCCALKSSRESDRSIDVLTSGGVFKSYGNFYIAKESDLINKIRLLPHLPEVNDLSHYVVVDADTWLDIITARPPCGNLIAQP